MEPGSSTRTWPLSSVARRLELKHDPRMSSVARFTRQRWRTGRRVLRFHGRSDPAAGSACCPTGSIGSRAATSSIDLSGVGRMDTIGAWLVHRTARERGGEIIGADAAVTTSAPAGREGRSAGQGPARSAGPVPARARPGRHGDGRGRPDLRRTARLLRRDADLDRQRRSAIRAASASTRSSSASRWSGSTPSGSSA